MSEDGCAKTAIDCVEETPGIAKTVLSVKNYCEDYATKEQLEEIMEILAEQMEEGPGCQGENMEEKNIKEGKNNISVIDYIHVFDFRSQTSLDWTW